MTINQSGRNQMQGNKYQSAVTEVRSVLSDWMVTGDTDHMAQAVVDRLIAKGVIQSTDPDELVKVF
jgi:hypothetical protein